METLNDQLTVKTAADFCRVGRSTVTYWIRAGKLDAVRSGNKYLIPVDALKTFLNRSYKQIPFELENRPAAKSAHKIPRCYEYWKASDHGAKCQNCVVKDHQLDLCFIAQKSQRRQCQIACRRCDYYNDAYGPTAQIVDHFGYPAGVCKDFYLLGANHQLAEICGTSQGRLVGLGLERIFHPDSIGKLIGWLRAKALGDTDIGAQVFFLTNPQNNKIKIKLFAFPLNQIAGSLVLLAEPIV